MSRGHTFKAIDYKNLDFYTGEPNNDRDKNLYIESLRRIFSDIWIPGTVVLDLTAYNGWFEKYLLQTIPSNLDPEGNIKFIMNDIAYKIGNQLTPLGQAALNVKEQINSLHLARVEMTNFNAEEIRKIELLLHGIFRVDIILDLHSLIWYYIAELKDEDKVAILLTRWRNILNSRGKIVIDYTKDKFSTGQVWLEFLDKDPQIAIEKLESFLKDIGFELEIREAQEPSGERFMILHKI